ncbi:hypothetical protein [Streptomyces roseolilacinus]|uniref:hypothetical protein n=1 Tax=Streptomyces roseolilacinus TaxID=66904 RepID=UPI001672D517|nr:hypothetical protein [Streptomyces roseolilacinus]
MAFADFRMTDRLEESYVGEVGCAGEPAAPDCLRSTRADATGPGITPEDADRIVRNATGTGADYIRRSEAPESQNILVFRGLQGEVPDPERAARRMMRLIEKDEQVPFRRGPHVQRSGPYRDFPVEGAPGAVMICQDSDYSEVIGTEISSWSDATCIWADRSTVAATRGHGIRLDELAALTAELHGTARVRR